MQPVTAASKALDQLRYLAPGPVVTAAEEVFDAVAKFFQAATTAADQDRLEAIARTMYVAKLRLQEELDRAADRGSCS